VGYTGGHYEESSYRCPELNYVSSKNFEQLSYLIIKNKAKQINNAQQTFVSLYL
jgi:hypothetical protein